MYPPQHRFRLLLNQGRAEHQALPKEYELDITEPSVKNTFMFTEQDLPGFASKNKARADAAAAGIPSHLLRQKVDKPAQDEQPQHRGRRRGPYYRKAIPSKSDHAWGGGHRRGVALPGRSVADELLPDRKRKRGSPAASGMSWPAIPPRCLTTSISCRSVP